MNNFVCTVPYDSCRVVSKELRVQEDVVEMIGREVVFGALPGVHSKKCNVNLTKFCHID